ncbi:hypothetical protein B484DRAFT_356042, partial [Ochromonadaceae sp. CCMP2298]
MYYCVCVSLLSSVCVYQLMFVCVFMSVCVCVPSYSVLEYLSLSCPCVSSFVPLCIYIFNPLLSLSKEGAARERLFEEMYPQMQQ